MKTSCSLFEGLALRKSWACYRIWAYRFFGVLLVSMILVSAHVPRYSGYLVRSLDGHISTDDSELLEYIRNEILQPPSDQPYDLLGKANIALKGIDESEVFYNHVLWEVFKDKRNGFFVEAGALDGETMSNTLTLERELNWTGLLIEPDELDYKSLTIKHRKAWTANVCLSPNPYPSKEMLTQHIHYAGPMAIPLGFKMRAMHGLASFSSQKALGNSWFAKVQCIPLESMLMALRVTRVDLLVLDIEGAEMAVLKHFDLDKFDVQVVCLEWKVLEEIDDISRDFEKRGYKEIARNREDVIFIKKGSPYMPKSPLKLPEFAKEKKEVMGKSNKL
ncbi:protein Star-like [Palaemon carinicauda]|uniref:protein Star-like n=1 Tax=Palaemon carinicauda TaxID=392227 RepID=UPI0035B6582A